LQEGRENANIDAGLGFIWRISVRQDYTNRLRYSEYVTMPDEAGYKIVFERKYLHEQAAQEVKHMKLWGRFRSMDVNDLATTYSHVVAKP
jgi:hypothetical protein